MAQCNSWVSLMCPTLIKRFYILIKHLQIHENVIISCILAKCSCVWWRWEDIETNSTFNGVTLVKNANSTSSMWLRLVYNLEKKYASYFSEMNSTARNKQPTSCSLHLLSPLCMDYIWQKVLEFFGRKVNLSRLISLCSVPGKNDFIKGTKCEPLLVTNQRPNRLRKWW